MKRFSIAVALLGLLEYLGGGMILAQGIDDLNLQVHGYVTQGFIHTNHNSWNTTDSENGSAAWSETVVNLSLQPQPKLRIGVQARYYLMGDFGDQIILDWAQLDYKVNDRFGFRVGDVKTPMGLLNETQDIDPANLWVLLPQSVYPIASRSSILDHYGAVVYGAAALWAAGRQTGVPGLSAGERVLSRDDGYFQTLRDAGLTLPNGMTGPIYGGTVRWNTPLRGLMAGASEIVSHTSGEVAAGAATGTVIAPRFESPYFFAKYERGKLMLAGEYNRLPALFVNRVSRTACALRGCRSAKFLCDGELQGYWEADGWPLLQ